MSWLLGLFSRVKSLPGWLGWGALGLILLGLAGLLAWQSVALRAAHTDLHLAEQGRAMALAAVSAERDAAAIERIRMADDLSAMRRRAAAADAARLHYQSIIEGIDHVQSTAVFDPALMPARQRLRARLRAIGQD